MEPTLARHAIQTHALKLDLVTSLLKENPDDQAVMFIQDAAQFAGIKAAFDEAGITYKTLETDAESQKIEDFKHATADETQVLVLEITKEYAAGTNLFNANHVIFLSPFFTTNEDDYAEKKLQAIRRVFRQGQEKPVYIHNFVSSPFISLLFVFTPAFSSPSSLYSSPKTVVFPIVTFLH
jgi:SNF2 family DNA or RNA helicase